MALTIGWLAVMVGLCLGAVAALVPGFPGCAVALLGVVSLAGMTDFTVLPAEAVLLCALLTVFGAVGQLAGPAVSSRALGGSAGVATGAALGGAVGVVIPIPGLAWGLAIVGGAVFGLVFSREGVMRWLRGAVGATGGCCASMLVDLAAVLAQGAIVGLAAYLAGA